MAIEHTVKFKCVYGVLRWSRQVHQPLQTESVLLIFQESLQIWQPCNHSDFSCPICLQTATLPVETNCGHLFCGSCLITYWKHSPWLAAITCPLCRQKKHDKPSKQIVHDIRDYNKRFSGQPRPVNYLYDMPLFLTLALRGIFTWGVLVWLFFLRVAVCSFGTIVCLSSPFDMKPGPLCRTLGTADDMVVVSLLLICLINICQQIVITHPQEYRFLIALQ
uniref:Uncharacterized protein n=1 Tax=Melopsittacus undulatus TaxID=13146 RepID=A0A8V5G4C4_MELUD